MALNKKVCIQILYLKLSNLIDRTVVRHLEAKVLFHRCNMQ